MGAFPMPASRQFGSALRPLAAQQRRSDLRRRNGGKPLNSTHCIAGLPHQIHIAMQNRDF
jgi:hypothetical protein